jgi:hypothetical protein
MMRSRTIEGWENILILILGRLSDFAWAWAIFIPWPRGVATRADPLNLAVARDKLSEAFSGDDRARADFASFNPPFPNQFVKL